MMLRAELVDQIAFDGTSQVSVSTKIVKATWIAARPQWYFWSIGLTNSVQPYCRLAIITMQMMPKMSCHHLLIAEDVLALCTACVVVVISIPLCFLHYIFLLWYTTDGIRWKGRSVALMKVFAE